MADETTSTTLSEHTRIYYTRLWLDNLKHELVMYDFTEKEEPQNGYGPTVQWSRFAPMGAATTALTKGTTPSKSKLTSERVTALMEQYGDYVELSDELQGFHILGPTKFMDKAIQEMAYGGALTVDELVRNAFGSTSGSPNYSYPRIDTDLDSIDDLEPDNHYMGANDIRYNVKLLKKRKVPKWDAQHYIAIIGPDQSYDLQGESGTGAWMDVNKYNSNLDDIRKGEIGKLFGARVVENTNLSTLSVSGASPEWTNELTECYFFGRQAVGAVNFSVPDAPKKRFKNVDLFVQALGSGGTTDPLHQRATIGWKVNFVAKRLSDARVQILRVGGSK